MSPRIAEGGLNVSARITVIKRSMNMDIVSRYLPEDVGTATLCRDFTEGQAFEIPGDIPARPEGFCEVAWQAIERNVARACKGEKLMRGNAFPCCTDGLRPVTFHIEPVKD
jgi:uncharacterized repeat protein (TIGR04076 family)